MTVNQQIVTKVIELMQSISIDNGYSFDMDADRVYDSRQATIDSGWAISVYDSEAENDEDGGYNEHNLTIDIELTGTSGDDTQTDLRERIQDILTAFSEIENESYVAEATYDGHEKLYDHDETIIGQANIHFSVTYKSDRWKL